MTEPSKAMRQVLWASVRGLKVTRTDLTAEGDAIVLNAGVAELAGFLAHEKVEVLNATTGARFSTMVAVSQRLPGMVEVSGPAAHFVSVGDRLVVSSWAWMKEKAAAKNQPRWLVVDERNQVVVIAPSAKAPGAAPVARALTPSRVRPKKVSAE
jgi:aspartate 1-decarboxylase